MKSFAEKKVVGGKLVGVIVEHSDRLDSIRIVGDFFLYPEDSLRKIEGALIGLRVTASKRELTGIINKVLTDEHAEFIGMTSEIIAETILDAVMK